MPAIAVTVLAVPAVTVNLSPASKIKFISIQFMYPSPATDVAPDKG